jgi:hypothetical protein
MLNSLLLLWVESADHDVCLACRERLIWSMQDDAPFAGMARAYLGEKCPKLAKPAVPHRRMEERNRLERIREMLERQVSKLKRLA